MRVIQPLFALLFAAACGPSGAPEPTPDTPAAAPAGYALVVARAVRQDDPRPAPCGPDRSCGDSMFRGRFEEGRTIAGVPVPVSFDARIRFHTPLITPTELALIVERRTDGSLTVLRRAGFNARTGTACFVEPDEQEVDWRPVAPGVTTRSGTLCYRKP